MQQATNIHKNIHSTYIFVPEDTTQKEKPGMTENNPAVLKTIQL